MSDSDSTNFSGTITGGIQDISALLPLLGTEQCEKHIGSALDRGYLYSSVTPVSIFGSLGIVRATFNILIASLSFEKLGFLGASKLRDGGFSPNGDVAPLIAFGSKHSKRFTVEARLEAMLTEEHIENVEDLTVSWGEGIVWWNFLLFASTLIMSSAGLLPYILLVLNSGTATSAKLFPLGFGFPILRVVGSALCVILTQFLVQIRIMVLLKTRLLFITIDRLAKLQDIDIGREIKAHKGGRSAWKSELASERCIWALRKYLSSLADDPEKSSAYSSVKSIYTVQSKRQLESIDTLFPRWINLILVSCLFLGCCSTVVGYIGCFYVIQHSVKSNGPLLWLVLEALLSVFRILVWAINPSWDDSKGIVFELQLSSHPPLITCNASESDFSRGGVVPLMRSNSFLEEVVAYTGPFPAFNAPDATLYYVLTAKGGTGELADASALLYIALSDHKEQTSRLLFKEANATAFSIYSSLLEPVPGSTVVNAKVDFDDARGKTKPRTHFLTSDAVFMRRLGKHYDDIIHRIHNRSRDRKAIVNMTWAMQKSMKDTRPAATKDQRLETRPLATEDSDMAYLRHGQIERRARDLFKQLEEWIGIFMTLYTKELYEDISSELDFATSKSKPLIQKHEANEVEFLLIECQKVLELLCLYTAWEWDKFVKDEHAQMRDKVLRGKFGSVDGPGGAQQDEEIRKGRMRTRLEDEFKNLYDNEIRTRDENKRTRLAALVDSTNQRIQARTYDDPAGPVVVEACGEISKYLTLPIPNSYEATKAAIAKWRKDANEARDERQREAKQTTEFKNALSQKEQRGEVDKMFSRCQKRADLLFARLNAQIAEFEDLHTDKVLTQHEHELMKYWSTPSLQERRRLLSRSCRYLRLDNEAIETVGGPQNMLRALKRSQDFLYMDLKSANLLEATDIATVIDSVKSVTGISPPRRATPLAVDMLRYLRALRRMLEKYGDDADEIQSKHSADEEEITADENSVDSPVTERLPNQGEPTPPKSDHVVDVAGQSEQAVDKDEDAAHDDGRATGNHELVTDKDEDLEEEMTTDDDSDDEEAPGEASDVVDEALKRMKGDHLHSDNDVCFFANANVTDYYRTGTPYLVFGTNGRSCCTVSFLTKGPSDHVVTVRHNFTTVDSGSTKLVIKLNDHDMTEFWAEDRQKNNLDYWGVGEEIRLPSQHLKGKGERNTLEIILGEDSPSVYWLSDVFLPVRASRAEPTPVAATS